MTIDFGGIRDLGQQNIQQPAYGQQQYLYLGKTVEQQIAEASPEKLLEWYKQIKDRVHSLHTAANKAYAEMYPGASK